MYVEEMGLIKSRLPFPLFSRGKVRDIYDFGDKLLIVTTDRMSAFDRLLENPVRDKGKVLNQMTVFWMRMMGDIVPNHIIEADSNFYPKELAPYAGFLRGRSMLVKKAKPIPIEFIVRGHISGSAWESYKKDGTICGMKIRDGLLESECFPFPLFTPSTKAEIGKHDENISPQKAAEMEGEIVNEAGRKAIEIYKRAYNYAMGRGIIIADTKFEFGFDENGGLMLIDEVLTPDSSRFWDAAEFEKGKAQKSFDKQPLRDWIKENDSFDVPFDVLRETSERYKLALKRLV